MRTHNVCFRGEIRKILCGYPLLSVAMGLLWYSHILVKNVSSRTMFHTLNYLKPEMYPKDMDAPHMKNLNANCQPVKNLSANW